MWHSRAKWGGGEEGMGCAEGCRRVRGARDHGRTWVQSSDVKMPNYPEYTFTFLQGFKSTSATLDVLSHHYASQPPCRGLAGSVSRELHFLTGWIPDKNRLDPDQGPRSARRRNLKYITKHVNTNFLLALKICLLLCNF